jgi:hypothetical protein
MTTPNGNALNALKSAATQSGAPTQGGGLFPPLTKTGAGQTQYRGDDHSRRQHKIAAAGGVQAVRMQFAEQTKQQQKKKNRGQANRLIRGSLGLWPSYAEAGADQDHMARWVLAYLLTTTFDLETSKTRALIDLIAPTGTAGQQPTDLSTAIDVADQVAKKKEEVYAKKVTATVLQATGLAALVQLVPFLDTALKIADLVQNVTTVWDTMTDINDIEALIQSGHEAGILGLIAVQMLDFAAKMKAEAVTNAVVGALNITVNIALPNILSSVLNAARNAKESADELMALTEFVFALRVTQHNLATLASAAVQGDLIKTLPVAARRTASPDDMSLDANLTRLAAKLMADVPQPTAMKVLRWVVQTNPMLAPMILPDHASMEHFLTNTVVLQGDDAPTAGLLDKVVNAIDQWRDRRAYKVLQDFVASADGNALSQALQLRRATDAMAHIDNRREAAWNRMTTCAFGALLLGLKPSGFLTAGSSTPEQVGAFDDGIFSLPPPMTVPRRLGPAKVAILAMTRQAGKWRKDRDLTVTPADLRQLVGMRNALNATTGPSPSPPPIRPSSGFSAN